MDKKELASVHVALPNLVEQLEKGRTTRRDFLRTSTLLGLSATAAYGIAGKITGEHFVAPARAQQGTPGGTVRISMNVMELSDPSLADWSQKSNIYRAVNEPLAKIGADNITRPYLAERWEANDDLTAWTFHLRQNATWSNGDAFIADDVVANIEKWLDEAHGSSNYSRFSSLEGAEAIDDHTVRFNLSSPDLAVPESLGDYPALIVHRDFWNNGGSFLDNPGTGPFQMSDYSVAERATLAQRTDAPWWGGDVLLGGIDIIDHGDDPSAYLAALASGQVDLLYEISADQVAAVRGMEDLELYETVTGQTGVARFHVTSPPFDDPRVRRAIRACIDHDVLLELAFQNLGTPGEDHHVAPIHPEYAELPRPQQDYDLARSLLAEAGYADGLDIEINCVAQPTWEPNTCQVIAEMLRPAGINLNVNILPGGTYWDRWTDWPFGFTSWTHRPLGVQVLNLAYRTGVPWNETNYSNPEFDALLDQANATLDLEARRAITEQLEQIIQNDSIIIQPYWRAIHTASNRNINGFQLQPAREFDFPVWSMSSS